MPDVEDSSPPAAADPSASSGSVLGTILHVVVVTILLSVSLFAYLNLYYRKYIITGNASLVTELVAYGVICCLYMYNSSRRQERFIFAGYLVLVLSVFLVSSNRIIPYRGSSSEYLVHAMDEIIFGANMVAISTYCVWQWQSFVLPMFTSMVSATAMPTSLKKTMATILHAGIVAILFAAVIIVGLFVVKMENDDEENMDLACLVQLVAYNAVGCLFLCNCSRQEKVKSVGFLILLLFVALLSSFPNRDRRGALIFMANILAISSYCICILYTLLRRWFDALHGDVVPLPPASAREEEEAVPHQHQLNPLHIQRVLREFSSDEIQAMTQDFGSMVGRGGSAQVFRGNLDDGTPVAVKRISLHAGRTMAGEEDFLRELSVIADVHQRSLVRLLGYSLQRQHGEGGLYLVYPFFENGSLDRWIFHGSDEQRQRLTWPKRLSIAVDVARALAYLHNECHWRILHLDVKPGNILLDGDLRAHVADFGISLSVTRGGGLNSNSVVDTEHLRGTFGYMAPEMLYNAVSDKSDVFSYGMTLLELVGGRRNMYPSSETPDLTRDYFPYIVREKVARGEVLEALDAAMAPVEEHEEEVIAVLKVALCCIQNRREMRPSMQTVVDMLEGRVAVELPPESHHHLL